MQQRFADKQFEGMTNYEDMVKYLTKIKSLETKPIAAPDPTNPVTVTASEPFNSTEPTQRQLSNNSSSFGDRGEARLILDLEAAMVKSPKFDLAKFRSSLESKDMYGNEQVSKQHVIQAANHSKLTVPKDVLSRWLTASDPINRGIYSIPKLVKFLERSQPDVINRVRTAAGVGSLSKSHGNLTCKKNDIILKINNSIEISIRWSEIQQ